MNEKRRKPAMDHAVALVGVAIGALVAACDAPLPTELRETVDEVTANEAGERRGGTVAGPTNQPAQSPLAKWFESDDAPLVFVDDVRIETPDALPEAVRLWIEGGRDDDLTERVKVVRGTRAGELYGEEGANGAILIFTGRDGSDGDLRTTDRPPTFMGDRDEYMRRVSVHPTSKPNPLVLVGGQRVRPPAVPSNLPPYQFGQAVWGAFLWDVMSLDIWSFEIIKGAAATFLYGEEAVGGVIDITTKNPGSAR